MRAVVPDGMAAEEVAMAVPALPQAAPHHPRGWE